MKFQLSASASSHNAYKREEIYEDESMNRKEWDSLSEVGKNKYLREIVLEFVFEDIEANAEPI